MVYVFNIGAQVVCLTYEGNTLTNVETGAQCSLKHGESIDWLLQSWGASDVQSYEYTR